MLEAGLKTDVIKILFLNVIGIRIGSGWNRSKTAAPLAFAVAAIMAAVRFKIKLDFIRKFLFISYSACVSFKSEAVKLTSRKFTVLMIIWSRGRRSRKSAGLAMFFM